MTNIGIEKSWVYIDTTLKKTSAEKQKYDLLETLQTLQQLFNCSYKHPDWRWLLYSWDDCYPSKEPRVEHHLILDSHRDIVGHDISLVKDVGGGGEIRLHVPKIEDVYNSEKWNWEGE